VKNILKVPVDDLQVGMYVAELDRPWLETPFPLQGFYVRSELEIKELKSLCDHIFISPDSMEGGAPGFEQQGTREVVEKPGGRDVTEKGRFSLRSLFGPLRRGQNAKPKKPGGCHYKETVTFKEEIRAASDVKEQAVETLKGVMKNLKRSGDLDVGQLQTTITPMVDSVLRNPSALACLVRLQKKDDYLYHHSLASSVWATILGRQLGLGRSNLDSLALGAMLLDVGKTNLPNELLAKPGRLTLEETSLMQQHIEFGLEMLDKSRDVDKHIVEMVACHHERHDGSGYPAGLKGKEISVFGRIAGVVDSYDAMISPRPYADLLSSYEAIRKLHAVAGVEFQMELIEQFTRAIGAFPTGTLVELNTGAVGIVMKQNRLRRLRPQLILVTSHDKQLLDNFLMLDLDAEELAANGEYSQWIERGLSPGSYGIDPTEYYLS
jgi:HD-GYP domain-containing protein (c-di-GMP phosphodiesterase class II)